MRTINKAVLLSLAAALSVQAVTMVESVQTQPTQRTEEVVVEASREVAEQPAPVAKPVNAGEGLFATGQPLQMINPLALAEYGTGEQNVARDPVDGHVVGLRLFSVGF